MVRCLVVLVLPCLFALCVITQPSVTVAQTVVPQPKNIELIGQFPLTATQAIDTSPNLVEFRDNELFTVIGNQLQRVGLTTSLTMTDVTTYSLDHRVYDMDVGAGFVYLAVGEFGVEVVNGERLYRAGKFSKDDLEDITYIDFQEPYLYATGRNLWVLDMTNPRKPIVAGFYPNVTGTLSVAGNYIWVQDGTELSLFEFTAPKVYLRLSLVDSDNRPIPFETQLLLSYWYLSSQVIDMPMVDDYLMLPLDNATRYTQWPEYLDEWGFGEDFDFYHVYLKPVDGYVPIQSEKIYPIGRRFDYQNPELEIGFLDTQLNVQIDTAQVIDVKLTARKPQSRTLRLVDEAGQPISAMPVSMYRYWSSHNRCGNLTGVELLSEGMSDAQGRVSVPDGDFAYAFTFHPERTYNYYDYTLKTYNTFLPTRLTTSLTQTETVISFRRPQTQTLEITATQDGKPAVGKNLYGQLSACGCGACRASIAVTDKQGKILLNNFYPEQWLYLYFTEGESYDTALWLISVDDLVPFQPLEVDLTIK